ncbi:hypothetical protein VOLCADRAFT_95165 [Volvox carteri f. nagariensis]|uniref:Gamma tubulin complex component C-terminal domain-containing protein n=1 Tax=Volvox carteri f. nagariensis TaxID=3068 RepID=D8U6S4_VOLCA|nr:uncharacterized protein VOLCADRAFT_95165 [Volvox carteri f. nagariensis]EFJ44490.1 hypothetical protein VOLCADRAFT_95165 [Volvox carteri f. nagariensis]|eukprot:XP_002954340.1 hypothetical protein VOLCADRAFT_95165 [Volvox carteri f. nagariensis]
MSASSSSIYWNIWHLVQQVPVGTNGQAKASIRRRRLRAKAYAILLDMAEEPYPDVAEDERQLINVQTATEELLRLRSEGRHGTASQLSWRLDQLSELQQQQQRFGTGTQIDPVMMAPNTGLTGPDACEPESSLTPFHGLGALGGGSDGGSGAAATAAVFDGIPVCQRLRLLPPPVHPRRAASAGQDIYSPDPVLPAPSPSPHPPPLHFLASARGPLDSPTAAAVRKFTPAPGGGGAAASGASDSPLDTSWFPFRDCAGQPLLPALDAPLEQLLLGRTVLQSWGPVRTADPAPAAAAALSRIADGTASNGVAAGAAAGMTPAVVSGDVPSVAPLLAGPLSQQTLVHTRFHHFNPLLLRLDGTRSECFRLQQEEANIFTAAAGAAGAAGGNEEDGSAPAAAASVSNGSAGLGRGHEHELSLTDVPVPFALASLGLSADWSGALGCLLPLPPAASASASATWLPLPPTASAGTAWPAWTQAPVHARTRTGDLPSQPSLTFAPSGSVSLGAGDGGSSTSWFRIQHLGASGGVPLVVSEQTSTTGQSNRSSRTRAVSIAASASAVAAVAAAAVPPLGTAGCRSTEEDEVLLYDVAVMALQGVGSALWMLRNGMIRSHRVRLTSQSRLLFQMPYGSFLRCTTGSYRSAAASYGNRASGGGGDRTPKLPSPRRRRGRRLYGVKGPTLTPPPPPAVAAAACLVSCYASRPFASIYSVSRTHACACLIQAAAAAAATARSRSVLRRGDDDPGTAAVGSLTPRGAAAVAAAAAPPPPPQLAPSLWQVYGFPQGPELLDRLHASLMQTDHAKTPLLRLLFAAASMPYVRRNLLTAAGLQMRLLEELSGELGDIAARFRRMAAAEAEEARLIAQQYDEALAPTSTPASAAAAAAAHQASGASATAAAAGPSGSGGGMYLGNPAAAAAAGGPPLPGIRGTDLLGGGGGGGGGGGVGSDGSGAGAYGPCGDEFNYPIVFGLEALQQVSEAAAAAAAVREFELTSLLTLLDRRRQAAAAAADQRVLAAAEAALAEAEAARAVKAAAAQERRLARSRLLAEQRAELDERAARARAEKERRVAEEQAVAAEAVLREHNEAAAALAAELARLRASYGGASYSESGAAAAGAAVAAGMLLVDERAAAAAARLRRCEWREARMALAARRRLVWLGIQAEELAQLREVVAAARSAQTAAAEPPGLAAATASTAEPPANYDGSGGGGRGGMFPNRDDGGVADLPSTPAAEHQHGADSAYDKELTAPPPPPPPPGIPGEGDALWLAAAQSSPAETPRKAETPRQSLTISLAGVAAAAPSSAAAGGSLRVLLPDVSVTSPRLTSSPRSSGLGSPVVVAHIARPRRATVHDLGPSLATLSPIGFSPAAAGAAVGSTAMTPPSTAAALLRAHRVSDGGGSALRTPHRDVGQRPTGHGHNHHHSGAKRSRSITGLASFTGALSPSVSGPASWNASGPGGFDAALSLAGPGDPWARGTTQGTGFLRPPSPGGGGGRQGPPRGYMPSAWGPGGRGPAGRGGAAGGLLLQLQSRQSRRRWALPDAGGAAAGPGPVVAPLPFQAAHSLQTSGVNAHDAEALLRRQQALTPEGNRGAAAECGSSAEAAAADGQRTPLPRASDTAAVALWSSACRGPAAATPGAGGGACLLPSDLPYGTPPDSSGDVSNGGVQPRRRALWKVPAPLSAVTVNTGAASAAGTSAVTYGRTSSSLVGVLPASSSINHIAGPVALDSWRDPVKSLLWEYLNDPRVAKRSQLAYSPSRRGIGGADAQFQPPQHPSDGRQLLTSDTPPRNAFGVVDLNRYTGIAVGGGSGVVASPRSRGRAAVSEDLAYAPVDVAVQNSLYGTVLAQYRLTTRAVWHVLVHEYRLLHYCEALRRFFFCEAGDVAGSLADSLTRRVEARPHVSPSTAELRAMLDEALQGCSLLAGRAAAAAARMRSSAAAAAAAAVDGHNATQQQEARSSGGGAVAASAAGDGTLGGGAGWGVGGGDEAARVVQLLHVRSIPRRILGTGSYFASDVLLVTCQVPRPLDTVITADCMRDYADVFSILLRVRCAASVLTACWSRLNAATGSLVARELGRAATQIVTLLRQHLQMELQGRCWESLSSALQGPSPKDLISMRAAHCRYLALAREVCMLPPREGAGPGLNAAAGGAAGAVPFTPSIPSSASNTTQPAPLRQQQLLPGAPLMDVLQCTAALATVLRRALVALEIQAASSETGLSAPPRQPTVSPVLSAVNCSAQTAGGGRLAAADEPAVRDSAAAADVAPDDLDELWAHVVLCQGRLGRALGALHGEVRRGAAGSAGGSGGSEGVSGLLNEMMAVLSAEPCRRLHLREGTNGGSPNWISCGGYYAPHTNLIILRMCKAGLLGGEDRRNVVSGLCVLRRLRWAWRLKDAGPTLRRCEDADATLDGKDTADV